MEERLYDLVFICMPATPEEEIAKMIARSSTPPPSAAARWRKWRSGARGRWLTAWPSSAKAFTCTWRLRSTQGELIKELERRLKVSDAVIKYMTVRLDEEIKRQQKLVGRREHRARRRPRKTGDGGRQPAPAAPARAAPAAAPAPKPPARPPATPASSNAAKGLSTANVSREISEEENYERRASSAPHTGHPRRTGASAAAIRAEAAARGGREAVPADRAAASASISARRRCAASAWSGSTSLTTRKSRCSSPSCRTAVRSCRGA